MAALADLSYDAGVRALDLQERAVEQLRSRTGTLLAAASLTASFLGGQTISHTRQLGALEVLALAALAASVGLCVYVLMPKEGFTFSLNAAGAYEELFASPTMTKRSSGVASTGWRTTGRRTRRRSNY